jgi:hypothetical protein
MPIGCYQVRFDHGGTVQLSPDEVITGVNLFHEQVRTHTHAHHARADGLFVDCMEER